MQNQELLKLDGISKAFGKMEVLSGINFTIMTGEVVALVGDNGAGKSTLIKIITGVHKPTTGEIFFKNQKTKIKSVSHSRSIGIEAVYQERALADQQELYRNIFAGREITHFWGFMNIQKEKEETEKILKNTIGFTSKAITMNSTVENLSGGEKQGIAFGRSLYFDADLIILDEPTMGLSLQETEKVLGFVKGLKIKNKSAIFIDHNIFHVYDVADRFIILDRGKVMGQFKKEEISQKELMDKMISLHHSGNF